MTDTLIFIYGVVVSLVVSAGFASLFWAAVKDGEMNDHAEEAENSRAG